VLETQEAEAKTSDAKQLIMGCFAIWRIDDPLKFYIRVVTVPQAEEQLRSRINEVRDAIVGLYSLSDFVNLDAQQLEESHKKIEDDMLAAARDRIKNDYGVDLIRVGIRRISLPEQVTQKVFEAMIEERGREATRYSQAGAARAKAIEAEAQAQADQILSFARTKAQEIESEGIQAATRMLGEIGEQDREFFVWLRQLDALKAALKEKATIFLDTSTELMRPFVEPPAPGAIGSPAGGRSPLGQRPGVREP
jgi:membrane protease subunit HflC